MNTSISQLKKSIQRLYCKFDEKDIENIEESLIQILQNTTVKPVCMGADESPQGVYDEVVNRIHICSERLENNPKALVFTKDNVGYIRKEILGLLKLLGKLIRTEPMISACILERSMENTMLSDYQRAPWQTEMKM